MASPGHELARVRGLLVLCLKRLLCAAVAIEAVQTGADIRKAADGLVEIAGSLQVALRQQKGFRNFLSRLVGPSRLLQLLLGAKQISIRLLLKFTRAGLEAEPLGIR